jgi:peptide/nickel transport system substrate-binding protein
MKRKWLFALLALLMVSALVITACGNGNEGNNGDDTGGDEAVEKVVTIAWTQEADSLNRYYTNMWYSAVTMDLNQCSPWLYDENNEPFAYMLTELPSISADGLVITYNLREDLVWSDGTALTAADFVFTVDMILDTGNIVDSTYPYDMLTSYEAVDDYTYVMTLSEPLASWFSAFNGYVLPKHVLEPVFEAEGTIDNAEWNLAPTVGCGPFVFEEWETGSFISFVKNENFWGGEAKLDKVVFLIVPDDAAQTAAVLAGDADIAFWPPYDDIPKFQEAGLGVVTQASGYNEGWFFNMREMASPAIQDLQFRKALAMSIDREQLAADLRLGVVKVNDTFWDALPTYVSPDIVPWPYDPDTAMALLDDAGYVDADGDGYRDYPDGSPLTISIGSTTKEVRVALQAVVQQMLKDVGINLETVATDALFDSYADGGPAAVGDLDIFEWSDAPWFPDPESDYWLCDYIPSDEYPDGYNWFICDEELDALFQAQSSETDFNARVELFHQITLYMHENVYYLGIWEDPDIWILNPRLADTLFSGITPFFNIVDWDVTE